MKAKTLWSIVIVVGAVVAGVMALNGGTVPGVTGMLADVGVVVGVAPNPYNTLNDQLNQRQLAIEQEQADLAAREAAFASSTQDGRAVPPAYAWYFGMAVVVLALLVILNFYLDWRRETGAPQKNL
jgi:hypothetical protein